ncbi:uncharacterized protein G2W53_022442 [Senna tora]|uniref:Uncharacterized protein n=1 Tax=Senna tora TaxID=362788 RepID=A0A834WKH9_9FABA|nr:uncharacterized protein G2W53_022442 [Senna tora]
MAAAAAASTKAETIVENDLRRKKKMNEAIMKMFENRE